MYSTHISASTAEAGDFNTLKQIVHPSAPENSRAFGDPFVHYLEDSLSEQDLIRFWFSEKLEHESIIVDFEILNSNISWLKNETLKLTNEVSSMLILLVFFQEYTNNYYKDKAQWLSFRRIGEAVTIEMPYPISPISKYEIA